MDCKKTHIVLTSNSNIVATNNKVRRMKTIFIVNFCRVNKYKLRKDMCVITDKSSILGIGGIIGGERSGTEIDTKNILLESAYFDPSITRKTAKKLDLNSDAKFRFERGVDPQSVNTGLESAVELILEICGGEVSKFDVQQLIQGQCSRIEGLLLFQNGTLHHYSNPIF
jgi:phenylalanyl-tRNA synthetase beta subunit